MGVVLVFGVVLVVLFGAAFITKRRFGVLGLALTAGSMLGGLWTSALIPVVSESQVAIPTVSTAALVASGLVLAPALLLLFSGPTYKSTRGRLLGALLFAVFAFALLIEPLGYSLVLEGPGRDVYQTVQVYYGYIVTGGIVMALLDVLAIHTTAPRKDKGKH